MESVSLAETSRALKDIACDQGYPLYLQDWWQRTAARGRGRSVVAERNGKTLGYLKYNPRMLYWVVPYGTHFWWSHYSGPVIDQRQDVEERSRVACELANSLPKWRSFYFIMPDDTDQGVIKVFQSCGFKVELQDSFRFHSEEFSERSDILAQVLARGSMTMRQRYNKAKTKLDIVTIDAAAFFEIYERDLKARGKTSYADLAVAQDLARESFLRGQIRITAARIKDAPPGQNSALVAAIACVEDEKVSYYWMSTRDTTIQDNAIQNGSVRLLIADAITHAISRKLAFDFDGAVGEGISETYRGFRGTLVHRFKLSRTTPLEVFARRMRAAVGKLGKLPSALAVRAGTTSTSTKLE